MDWDDVRAVYHGRVVLVHRPGKWKRYFPCPESQRVHPWLPLLLLLAGGLGGLLFGVTGGTRRCHHLVLEVLGLGQLGERDAEGRPQLLGCLLDFWQGGQGFASHPGLAGREVAGPCRLAGAEGFALPVGLAARNGLFGLGSVPSVLAGPQGFLARWGAGDLLALLSARRVPGEVAVDVCPLCVKGQKKEKKNDLWLL